MTQHSDFASHAATRYYPGGISDADHLARASGWDANVLHAGESWQERADRLFASAPDGTWPVSVGMTGGRIGMRLSDGSVVAEPDAEGF